MIKVIDNNFVITFITKTSLFGKNRDSVRSKKFLETIV